MITAITRTMTRIVPTNPKPIAASIRLLPSSVTRPVPTSKIAKRQPACVAAIGMGNDACVTRTRTVGGRQPWMEESQMSERTEQRGDPETGVCHVCGQTFDTQRALSEHLMEVHEDDVLPTDPAED